MILGNENAKKTKCIYCGKTIEDETKSNNPFDNGLHRIKDKYSEDGNGDVCCSYCNYITIINRNLKRIIDNPCEIDMALFYIQDTLNDMKNEKKEMVNYYSSLKD